MARRPSAAASVTYALEAKLLDAQDLTKLVTVRMPYGKHQGWLIADLPGAYLAWFARKGFPPGQLGQLLALALEIDHNGLSDLLVPLRSHPPTR